MNDGTLNTQKEKRPGYKWTRLGWIPNEWEITKLGDLGNLSSGTTPLRANHNKYFNEGSINWVKTTDLNNGIITSTEECVTDVALKETSLKILPKKTLLVAMYGGFNQIGRTGLLGIEATINQALSALVIKKRDVNPFYVLNWMNFNIGYWKRFAASSRKDPNITKNDVKHFPFVKPPLPEQQKIAAILSTWDKAIELTQQLIEAKEEQKKGLMQRLLTGKVRVGKTNLKWENVKMKELFKLVEERNDGEKHVVMTVSSKNGLVSQKDKFDRIIAGDSLRSYTLIKKGDFAYNKGNSSLYPMGCIYQLENEDSALVPFVYICFRSKEEIAQSFYKYWFLGHGLDRQLKRIITSGARGDGLLNVNKKSFINLVAPKPPLDEQEKVGEIIANADSEIKLLECRLEALKEQKKGLMQQLLTGKIRVKIPDHSKL